MNNFVPDLHTFFARLERFEERFAVLLGDAGLELRWPIKNLPENIKLGDTIALKIGAPAVEDDEKYARMRRLLEELIN